MWSPLKSQVGAEQELAHQIRTLEDRNSCLTRNSGKTSRCWLDSCMVQHRTVKQGSRSGWQCGGSHAVRPLPGAVRDGMQTRPPTRAAEKAASPASPAKRRHWSLNDPRAMPLVDYSPRLCPRAPSGSSSPPTADNCPVTVLPGRPLARLPGPGRPPAGTANGRHQDPQRHGLPPPNRHAPLASQVDIGTGGQQRFAIQDGNRLVATLPERAATTVLLVGQPGERQGFNGTSIECKPPTIEYCFEKGRIDSVSWGRDRSREGIIVSLPCPPLPSCPSFGNIDNSMFILTPAGPKCVVLGSNIILVMPVLEAVLEAIPEIAGGGMS
jgi:hypothetical protein